MIVPRQSAAGGIETIIGVGSTLADTLDRIMLDTDLAGLPVLER
ncbi:hypothetical protein [Streptomyces xantholiticus]|uniref:Uncharacterized protein n=1 Tax=Streptomyces xantholiticus TaxID=68285 RepID=A0ABV1UT55_9ACTN